MKYWRLLRAAPIAILMIALLAPAQSVMAAPACTISYSAQNDWGAGATMNVIVINSGTTAVNGWTLTWTFPGNQQISNLWNGTYTQTGASVSVKDLGYNANIPANGGSTNFGFNLSYSGTNAAPSSFSLNGIACNNGTSTPPPTTPPPTTPPPTTPPPTTPPPTTPPPTTPPPTTPPPTTPPPTTPPPTTPPPSIACQVAYSVSQWSNGFTADVKITNSSSAAIAGWTLTWSFANGQQITGAWNASVTQSGANVTASNPASAFNGTIGANGGTAAFGFQATHSGTNAIPATFRLNGVICSSPTATPPPTTPPPTTPPPTTPPPTTPPPTTPPPTTPPPTTPPPTTPPAVVWRVDTNGNITRNGVIIRVKGGSWFGLEGRHEPSSDPTNPSGAPMEQYMGNVFWAPSSRTYDQDIAEFKAMGINLIRLPLVPQTLTGTDPQGMAPFLKNSPSVVIPNSRLALETIIKKLDAAGIYVLLDIHSCSNYVGWRKGRFDARPPYADATRANYDFKREDSSCSATNNPSTVTRIQAYDSTKWQADLRTLAGMSSSLGVSNIMGIDIFNEPHDYTWAEWKANIELAYTTVNAVNPNILIFAEGVGTVAGTQDGTPNTTTQEPHGSAATNPNWGENLYSAGTNPPNVPKDRLVFSPHTYGPSVFVQKMFMDPTQPLCAGLEGDAAAAAHCNIVINPTLLRQGWQEHFGYLKAMGYAVVIGEFGGNMDWPGGKASLRDQQMFSYITDRTIDRQWQEAFVDYLLSVGIRDTIYWSINPESGDTGGIYTTPYQPGSNESGWGTWGGLDPRKTSLLARLWNN